MCFGIYLHAYLLNIEKIFSKSSIHLPNNGYNGALYSR